MPAGDDPIVLMTKDGEGQMKLLGVVGSLGMTTMYLSFPKYVIILRMKLVSRQYPEIALQVAKQLMIREDSDDRQTK